MRQVIEIIQAREDWLVAWVVDRVYDPAGEFAGYRERVPREVFELSAHRIFRTLKASLEEGNDAPFVALGREIGKARVDLVPLTELLHGLALNLAAVTQAIEADFAEDTALRLHWHTKQFSLTNRALAALADSVTVAREELIREQATELNRLSAPVLPVHPGVLLMPLVGTVDAKRASRLTLQLLEGIVERASEVVIIDVTGVPVIDEGVADHLLRAARAVNLVGAQVLLVGINPEVAQTLVGLGLDLGGFGTLGSLADGIKHALALQGKVITTARQRKKPTAWRP